MIFYDPSPAALVLSGDAATLSEFQVGQLLRSKTVIALFKPGRALLETIHKATNTPIDIPSLELVDDLPLLIYSVNGMVHIATNNVPSEAKIQDFVRNALEKDSDLPTPTKAFEVTMANPTSAAEQSVLAISHAMETVQNVGALVSHLVPPIGVISFKRGTLVNAGKISITWLAWQHDGEFVVETSDPSLIQKYDLNWYTDVYAYATGADCRGKTPSEFSSAGGVVTQALAIDRGSMRRSPDSPPRYLGPTSGYCGYYFVDWNKTGTHSGSMNMTGYQPRGLESQSGTTYKYSIDFQQDMQMFNNNGNTSYTFNAQYANHFSLDSSSNMAYRILRAWTILSIMLITMITGPIPT